MKKEILDKVKDPDALKLALEMVDKEIAKRKTELDKKFMKTLMEIMVDQDDPEDTFVGIDGQDITMKMSVFIERINNKDKNALYIRNNIHRQGLINHILESEHLI